MKKILLIVLGLFLTSTAFASSGKSELIFNAESLTGTGDTATSRVFNVGSVYRMGYWANFTRGVSTEGGSVALVMQASYATDGTYATYSTILPRYEATNPTIQPVATAGSIEVPSAKYIRFVAQARPNHATSSTLTAYLFTQEQN